MNINSLYITLSVAVCTTWWVKPLVTTGVGLIMGGFLSQLPNNVIDSASAPIIEGLDSKDSLLETQIVEENSICKKERDEVNSLKSKIKNLATKESPTLSELNKNLDKSARGVYAVELAIRNKELLGPDDPNPTVSLTKLHKMHANEVNDRTRFHSAVKEWSKTEEEVLFHSKKLKNSEDFLASLKKQKEEILLEKESIINSNNTKKLNNNTLGYLIGASLGVVAYCCYTFFCK